MPVNTIDLTPGGGPNLPYGLGQSSGGGYPFQLSSISSAIAATVQGSATSFVVVPFRAALPTDIIWTVPLGAGVSSVSSGLVPWSHCTQAGQIEFRLSNVSTLAQSQSAVTWYFTRMVLPISTSSDGK